MSNTNKPELPSVDSMKTDILTAEERGTYVFVVTDTTAVKLEPPNVRFTRLGIENADSNTGAIYIGGSDVENDSVALALAGKRGRKLNIGDVRDEDTTLAPYAIAADGKTCHVIVEWVR